jgi:pyruvate dehydrogenase E2 component (dihydrolipoamide acetyltransferase)
MVSVGDKVEVDQILLEIETDKATVEVPAEFSGIVKSVNVKDGDTAKVGDVMFTFEERETGKVKSESEEQKIIEEVEQKIETEEKSKQTQSSGGIVEFKMPELGENIDSAEVVKVLVEVGSKVKVDQILVEIETDKATVEVPAEFEGVIKEVKVKAGKTAKVGDVIFVIETGNVELQNVIEQPKVEPSIGNIAETVKEPVPEKAKAVESKTSGMAFERSFPNKIAPAAPSVRKFSREIGIDINDVNGSGPSGRISIDDVKRYSKSRNEKINSGGSGFTIGLKQEKLPDFTKWGNIRKEQMSNVRKKTAEHLSFAWATIPHVTQFDKADITDLEKLRKQFGKRAEVNGAKLTVTAILMKVIAAALKVFPQFNSSIDMDAKEIIFKDFYNIGIAVDTEKGLIVPVVRDADKKNILELASDLTQISIKARDKKVTIEDMQGATFTISNLGGIGGTSFTPIVNAPEVAILGVSRGSYEPVYKDGEFVPRLMLPLSLSYDHRIIDGADAARFIRWVVTALEEPFLLSLEG